MGLCFLWETNLKIKKRHWFELHIFYFPGTHHQAQIRRTEANCIVFYFSETPTCNSFIFPIHSQFYNNSTNAIKNNTITENNLKSYVYIIFILFCAVLFLLRSSLFRDILSTGLFVFSDLKSLTYFIEFFFNWDTYNKS